MGKKNGVELGNFKWKNTPAGPVLDTDFGDTVIAKILEETGNDKAKDVFDTLRDARAFIDDNILAH